MKYPKYRAWAFTLNNYTPEQEVLLSKIKCRYMVYGHETGDEKGTPHLQGYMYLQNQITETTIRSKTKPYSQGLNGIHWEPARSSAESNYDYCTKQDKDSYYESGVRPHPGARKDLTNVNQEIKNNPSMRNIIEKQYGYQATKHAELILKYNEPPRPIEPIEVIWIYGPTGTGKTKYVYKNYTDIFRPISFKWWEGYDGHKTVLIDEFRKDFCKFHELLSPLLDIYPFRVETKGGSRQAQYTTILITSCYHPKEVYDTREDIKQLLRRITKIIKISRNNIQCPDEEKLI